MCGKCCYQDIPLTVSDVHRIALGLAITDGEAFCLCVAEQAAPKAGTFSLRKRADRACCFLGEDKKCSIYAFKPEVCSFYPCPEILKTDAALWQKLYLSNAPHEAFWAHAIAETYTKQYIARFGTRWDEQGYFEALAKLEYHILSEKTAWSLCAGTFL